MSTMPCELILSLHDGQCQYTGVLLCLIHLGWYYLPQLSQLSKVFLGEGLWHKWHWLPSCSSANPALHTLYASLSDGGDKSPSSLLLISTSASIVSRDVSKHSNSALRASKLSSWLSYSVAALESPSALAWILPGLWTILKLKSAISSDHLISLLDRFFVDFKPSTAAESVISSKWTPAR